MKSIWRFKWNQNQYLLHQLVNLNENQCTQRVKLREMVDNMETKDLVQYVTDDMFQYMESLPDHIDECVNYWDDSFDDVIEEIKEYEQCDFKTLASRRLP